MFIRQRIGRNLEAAGNVGMNIVLFNNRDVQYNGNVVNNFVELKKMMGDFNL